MTIWVIKDSEGNITNEGIKASEEFVAANFEHYAAKVADLIVEQPVEEVGRAWRDQELAFTDFIVPLTDHPQHSDYMAYRILLRDWPSTSDFPDTKPTLGE